MCIMALHLQIHQRKIAILQEKVSYSCTDGTALVTYFLRH